MCCGDSFAVCSFVIYSWVLICETLWGAGSWAPGRGGGGVVAGQGRGCWFKFCIVREHMVCSLRVLYVCGPLISSSSSMTYSGVLLCETVEDLHARDEGVGCRGVAKSCSASRQTVNQAANICVGCACKHSLQQHDSESMWCWLGRL